MTWFRPVSMVWRLILAAAITGVIGMFIPEALGASFVDVEHLFDSSPGTLLLVSTLVFKVVLAVFAIGLGIPGGIIGPIFGLGVLLGLVVGNIVMQLDPSIHFMGTYAVLGMAGLMAACLHAPLAALVAVMELTSNPDAITPAIIVIAMAYITSAQFLKNRSIFLQQLDYQGLMYQTPPAETVLEKIGVLAELDQNIKIIDYVTEQDVRFNLKELEPGQSLIVAMRHDLGVDYSLADFDSSYSVSGDKVKYLPMQTINTRSTMAHAYEILYEQRDGATLITSVSGDKVVGIIKWEQIRVILMNRNALI